MNEKLIEKLRNGEIAIINDGTVEELNKVLKYAFPIECRTRGVGKYYHQSTINQNYYVHIESTDLPSYSVKDFLTEEFPEKWCVAVTKENKKILEDWRHCGKNSLYDIYYGFLCYDKIWSFHLRDCTEITFEQFKQHILMENKEIEYYKVLKNCWGIQGISWSKGNKLYATNTESLPYFKEIGLLDNPEYFKPVYKEEKTLPKINNYEGKLEGDYIVYGNNCAKFHKTFFTTLDNWLKNRIFRK